MRRNRPWIHLGCLATVAVFAQVLPTKAVTFEELHSFSNVRISPPSGRSLLQASDGNFYGTSPYGGMSNNGAIFQVTPSGTVTILVSFSNTNGSQPIGGLVQGSDGNLYGTTTSGGASNDGTVFKVTMSGTLTTLASFNGSNGAYPEGTLLQGRDGNFYGTTYSGGVSNDGTVFEVTPSGTLSTLASFNNVNGAGPVAGVIQGSDGNFYGTTDYGGTNNQGTVFKVGTDGTLTTLVSFNGSNGENPYAALVQGSDGDFYGTTLYGGASYGGTVFKITPSGTLTTLVSFNSSFNSPGGNEPFAGLILGNDGDFYGTTSGGGTNYGGTAFELTPSGTLTTLCSFAYVGSSTTGGLVQGSDGYLYGTTDGGNGTVFKISTSGSLTTLANFGSIGGANPKTALVEATDGNFYGTTTAGTAFRIAPSGDFATINNALSGNVSALLPGTDGNFYGTTSDLTGQTPGNVFSMTFAGAVTTVANFPSSGIYGWINNAGQAPLVEGPDGNFYGTASSGGLSDGGRLTYGTVFKMTPAGTLATVAYFQGFNGVSPSGALVLGQDGNFYGTTQGGQDTDSGSWISYGNVFKVTPSGAITSLASFNRTNGFSPQGIVQGTDGSFYGTTLGGGMSNFGTVFQVTPSGVLTTLASFTGTNGSSPRSGLIQGSDGNFYGTTTSGGTSNYGTLFQITPSGTLTTLVLFNSTNGASPYANLVQGSDGLYGTTYSGGSAGGGNVFRISHIDPFYATANNASCAYGTTPSFTGALVGVLNGGNITLDFLCPATSKSPPGSYTITPVPNAHGTRALADYDVTTNTGTLTITPAALTVTAFDTNCAVNTSIPSFSGSVVGLQNNDNITISFTTTATSGSPLGTYTITPVLDDHGTGALANYTVTSNPGTLTITPATATIVTQPVSVTQYAGSAATFSVIAGGTGPLSYQWYKGTSKIGGATGNVLNLSNVQSANAGAYKVLVSNGAGSVTSAVVTLTVLPSLPTIISLSPSQTNIQGSKVTFSISAVGSPTLSYQWKFNASSISGATTTSLKLSNTPTTAAGTYTVVVSNGNGSTTSDPIILTVVPETGVYSGLFYLNSGVANDSSGYFSFKLQATRAFKGNVVMASGKYSMAGQFDSSGTATVTVSRTGLPSLRVQLQLQQTNDTAQIAGSVSDGAWLATLLGDKAYYATGNVAPQARTYTMTFLTGSTGQSSAGEGSFGLATVKTNGTVTLTGQMSDTTGIMEATSISKAGVWPMFVSLYKGGGSLLGWVTFTNGPTYELTGAVSWIKTGAFGKYYAQGFTNTCTVIGSVRQ